MKHISSTYLLLFFSLFAQTTWAQTQDTTARPADPARDRTVVSDRINEVNEIDRGPSLSKLMKKADESFGKKNFFAAKNYYGRVLEAEKLNVEALAGYGESSLAISSLNSADSVFQVLVDHGLSPSPDYFPKMRLAEVKFRKGKYTDAAELYNAVATLPQTPPVPDSIKRIAALQLELCLWAQGEGLDNPYLVKGDTTYMLDTVNVNTRELYSEYVASIQGQQLYFSAYRFDFKKDRSNPKRNTIKVLKADGAMGALGPDHPMAVTEALFNDSKRQHTAHLSFTGSGKTVYYSLGDYVRDSADIRFDLYRRSMLTDSTWSVPEKLNRLNAVGFTTTEPCVGKLPGNTNETLFFVSDRPGGKGHRDIWFSDILGDSLTTPKPLAALNTDGDDVTPFYHSASNTFFFSTDSLKTLGGFDIYKSKPLKGGRWSTPEHLGAPINSSANDVFFVLDPSSNRGFFSSNRIGNTNYSEEGCCYDIYAVDFTTRYRAIALHDLTRKALPYTKITLYEVNSLGKFSSLASPIADSSSSYAYDVRLNQQYAIIGEKAGFIPDTLTFKTPEELWTREIIDTLYLRPMINLVASVYDDTYSATIKPLYGSTLTYFDLGSVDKAGNFRQNDAPGKITILPNDLNKKTYALEYGHKYRVLAGKEGYVAEISKADSSDIISTIGLVDGGTIEAKLYLHAPSALETYLPITLYFDNDYPKRTRATDEQLAGVTDPFLVEMRDALLKNPRDVNYHDSILIDYQKTFVGYMRNKEEYLKGVAVGLSGQAKQAAIDTIDRFFEQEVRMNWDSFFSLSDKIDLMLQNGDTIILTLKGYASPLSNPEYNKHLTNRRIASVFNHFMIFDGGAFRKYREVVGNGQLRFVRQPNGDTESVKMGISGDPRDRRLSVYDVHASRSRRVQIIGARVTKGSKEKTVLGLQKKVN